MHAHALKLTSEAEVQQRAVGVVPSGIRPHDHALETLLRSMADAVADEALETGAGVSARPNQPELHEQRVGHPFAAGAVMADRKVGQGLAVIGKQDGTQLAVYDGLDL